MVVQKSGDWLILWGVVMVVAVVVAVTAEVVVAVAVVVVLAVEVVVAVAMTKIGMGLCSTFAADIYLPRVTSYLM